MPAQETHSRPLKNGPSRRVKAATCAGAAFFLYAAAYGSTAVFAQRLNPNDGFQSLSQRILPEYTPNGYRTGSFTLSPSAGAAVTFNDNIYASDENKQSDTIFGTNAALSARSDFVRHALNASASIQRGLYQENSGENFTDYTIGMDGRLDVTGQTALPLSLSYKRDHYDRSVEEERSGTEPTVFDYMTASTGLIHGGQRIASKILATIERYSFQDTTNNNVVIDNSDRNRTKYSLYTSIGAQEEAVISPFVYSNIGRIQYDESNDNNGFDRSADEYELGIGAILNISDVTRMSVNAGRLTRKPDDTRLAELDALAYGVNLIWEPSTLATFFFDASRDFDETITENSSAATRTDFRLAMNYELFPNVILIPSVNYNLKEFEGTDFETKSFGAGLQMDYKLNQNVWLTSSYRYTTRDEKNSFTTNNANINDYSGNIYNLSLRLQF